MLTFKKFKRRVWNKKILIWWYKLWIRKDVFHPSLNIDPEAMMEMNKEELIKYKQNLIKRIRLAHKKSLFK